MEFIYTQKIIFFIDIFIGMELLLLTLTKQYHRLNPWFHGPVVKSVSILLPGLVLLVEKA